jgi:TolB protein
MNAPDFDGSFDLPIGELRIVNADGSDLRTLADAAPFAPLPSWSPDGSRLVFVGLPDGADPGAFDIETVVAVHDLDSGETSVLAEVEGTGLGEPTWSPDGETIAFTITSAGLFASSGALATVPASGGPITRVSESPGAYFSTPIWSPDGAWLAVSRSTGSDLNASLVAIRSDGTEETVLATGLISATAWRADPS